MHSNCHGHRKEFVIPGGKDLNRINNVAVASISDHAFA